jgi:hypothetical protein
VFFVRGIRNLVGCVLNRLFRIAGELFTLALRPLSEAFGLQLFRAGVTPASSPTYFCTKTTRQNSRAIKSFMLPPLSEVIRLALGTLNQMFQFIR